MTQRVTHLGGGVRDGQEGVEGGESVRIISQPAELLLLLGFLLHHDEIKVTF